MLRKTILFLAKKKNPGFQLDERIAGSVLFDFLIRNSIAIMRGAIRQLISFRKPNALFLGRRVRISGMKYLSTGKGVRIDNDVHVTAWSAEGVYIGTHSWIGSHSCIKASFSFSEIGKGIHIGRNVGIGEFAHLGGAGGLLIGDDCIIGPYFSCHPENHAFSNQQVLIRHQGTTRKGIHVGNNCWIGAKVTVLDGVVIGNNCVIAAGSVITKDIPSNAVVRGVPAKVVRYRKENEPVEINAA